MKTKQREEKKRIRNDTASDKDQLMEKIKKLNKEHIVGVPELKSQIPVFKAVKMSLTSTEIILHFRCRLRHFKNNWIIYHPFAVALRIVILSCFKANFHHHIQQVKSACSCRDGCNSGMVDGMNISVCTAIPTNVLMPVFSAIPPELASSAPSRILAQGQYSQLLNGNDYLRLLPQRQSDHHSHSKRNPVTD
jgi:hypothetical protein